MIEPDFVLFRSLQGHAWPGDIRRILGRIELDLR
jgi:hypothetical protein